MRMQLTRPWRRSPEPSTQFSLAAQTPGSPRLLGLCSASNRSEWLVAVFNLLLLALVLGTILLPAVIMLGFGFLCHSQFLRSQAPPCTSFSALLVTGFLLLCHCLCLPWLPTAASACACASAWPTASGPTAQPSTGAGTSHSQSKSQSHQAPGLFPHLGRSGFEVVRVKSPVDCPPGLSRT